MHEFGNKFINDSDSTDLSAVSVFKDLYNSDSKFKNLIDSSTLAGSRRTYRYRYGLHVQGVIKMKNIEITYEQYDTKLYSPVLNSKLEGFSFMLLR